jgi:hypothetical protein
MASLVDGGTFKCANHADGEEFETDNITEWKEHLASHDDLKKSGSGPCPICNEVVHFDKVPFKLNPVHPECLEALK